MFRSMNPVFAGDKFGKPMTWDSFQNTPQARVAAPVAATRSTEMTVAGSITASMILLAVCIAAAALSWWKFSANPQLITPMTIGATLVALCGSFAIPRMPKLAMIAAPVYAIAQGVFLGGVSLVYAKYFGKNPGGAGLITLAVIATFSVAATMLVLYRFRVIRASPMVRKIVTIGFVSLFVFFIAQLLLRFVFGVNMGFLWDGGPIAIGFCLVVIGLGCLSLVTDFDFVEQGAAQGLPKHYEWVAGVGILASLVILYIYILRLLAMLRSND